jgi:hypothetical protein
MLGSRSSPTTVPAKPPLSPTSEPSSVANNHHASRQSPLPPSIHQPAPSRQSPLPPPSTHQPAPSRQSPLPQSPCRQSPPPAQPVPSRGGFCPSLCCGRAPGSPTPVGGSGGSSPASFNPSSLFCCSSPLLLFLCGSRAKRGSTAPVSAAHHREAVDESIFSLFRRREKKIYLTEFNQKSMRRKSYLQMNSATFYQTVLLFYPEPKY